MKIFSFDAEANGLHGSILSVGACVLDTDHPGQPIDRARETFYVAREFRKWRLVKWVEKNVIPAIDAAPVNYAKSDRAIRDRFWAWMLACKDRGDLIVADCPWPVEASFLSRCVSDDIEDRAFKGPYPLVDVSTLLYAAGMDPLASYAADLWPAAVPHNPLHDAIVSALAAEMALRKLGRL